MAATIMLGSVGADVETWQGLLTSAGYAVASSGVFDEATKQQTIAWQKAKGLPPDGIVGPMSWGAMTGKAAAGKTDKYAQEGRDAMLAAWPQIQAEAAQSQYPEVRELGATAPTLGMWQIFGAMAQLESNYGHSPYKNKKTGESSGVIWNWGAVQAGAPPCNPATSFEVTDTGANGEYNRCFKKYPNSAAGALDFLRHVTIKRPYSWQAALEGDIDKYSVRMHSWTPPLEQLGAGHAGKKLNLDPITQTPGYFEQPPLSSKGRAYGLEYRIADIAFTLNEPIAAKRGGPVAPGEVVSPGGPDESGSSTPRKLIITGGILAALYAAWKIWKGLP